jgi:hypothetical protein
MEMAIDVQILKAECRKSNSESSIHYGAGLGYERSACTYRYLGTLCILFPSCYTQPTEFDQEPFVVPFVQPRQHGPADPGHAFRRSSETTTTRPLRTSPHSTSYSYLQIASFLIHVPIQVAVLDSPTDIELHSMPDVATVPLIAGDHRDRAVTNHDYGSDAESDELLENDEEEEVDESKLVAPGAFIWGLTICAGVSGLLFGYE